MKRLFSFLCVLCCASMMGWAVQYCDYPTGHLNDANYGDANGRILLTLVPTGNANEYQLTIKPNTANGNVKKLDYLYAIIGDGGTTTPYPIVAGTDESSVEDELSATFTYTGGANTMTIQWSYPDWAGRWQCTLDNINLSALENCTGGGGGDPTPDPDPEPEPDPVSYCDFPTGHESNPNFGDANGRILLSLEPTGNANEYKMTIKPNYANGATKKLDYLHVIAGGNTPYPATSGTDDDGNAYDEMSVTFTNSNATTSFTILWSNPDWGGRWQCALNDIPLTSLSACAGGGAPDPDPEPTEIYDVNFALASNGSSATASSGNAGEAIDGNEGSRWESSHTDDETWTLDMGQKRIFNTIKILWEGAYCKEFALTYSNDGESWSPLYTETNLTQAGWQTIELGENVTARYIKYHGTLRATGWGQSFFEFQAFLAGVSVLTSIDLTTPAQIAEVGGAGVALTAQPKDQNGQNMVEEVSWEITPAAAGHMSGNTYIPDQVGSASIRAYNGEVYSAAITIAGYEGTNVALNKTDDEITVSGYDVENGLFPRFAVDDNEGSLWSARHGETGAERIYDAWINVDLGAYYDINLIAIHWEGACSRHYHVDFSADNSAWRTAYNAGWNAMATHWEFLSGTVEDATKVRYVRVWSTEAVTQYGVKIMALKVYGIPWVPASDTEAPVMVSATLDSKTWNSVVLAVEATDNQGVAKFHVVDATNGIDAKYAPNNGKITITGLTAATAYNFTVTAIDVAQNESANSKSVAVTTTAHYTEPQAACAAPTWPANQVKAMYSPTYGADYTHQDWGSGTVYVQEEFGKKYTLAASGYFGSDGFSLNCLMMEKLHYDIWIENDATIRFVPIWGGAEQGITKSLTGQQWNSIDIDLSEYTNVTDWGNVYQMKIDQASNLTFWIANAYFYRESAIVDSEVPTNVSANLAETGFYSVKITAQAEDNSGAVNFRVMNGETILATGVAATATPTTITVNNLTPGTNYNFNVVAYDEAGNAASPVVVEATTKFVPAPIVPDFNAKVVLPVFTDAKACVVSNIHSGGWGETTEVEWLQIAPNDKVFYAQNFNYAGWHSWGGGDINASEMDYLHVDIYSTGMTQVSVTPISPGHEGSYTIELTPNAWTSADIPLSAYAANNIEWNKIFQFKFMGAVGGNELMIDNVYFWSYGVTTTSVMGGDDATGGWATFACAEKIQLPNGISAYKAVYSNEGNDEVLNLTELSDGIIPANAGVILHGTAGETFTFSLTDATPATDMNDNMLVGCAVRTDISGVAASNDIFCMRYSELFGITGFFLYTGQYIPAGKAYLPVPKDPGAAPASRRVRFVFNNENVATGVEQEANMQTTVCHKVIENGRLIIIRNGIRYTAEGLRVE